MLPRVGMSQPKTIFLLYYTRKKAIVDIISVTSCIKRVIASLMNVLYIHVFVHEEEDSFQKIFDGICLVYMTKTGLCDPDMTKGSLKK